MVYGVLAVHESQQQVPVEDATSPQTPQQKETPDQTTNTIPQHLARFLRCLQGVQPKGNGRWVSLCPFHDDQNPSLNIKLGEVGQVLFNCFVCNPDKAKKSAWLAKVKLSWAKLEPDDRDAREAARRQRKAIPPADLFAASNREVEDRAERAIFGRSEEQIELRNYVYSYFVDSVSLSKTHQRQLAARGLNEEAIKANGYFSIENATLDVVQGLRDTLFNAPLGTIPGYTSDGLNPRRGLFIPVRNAEGLILTAQVRASGSAKYLWMKNSPVIPHVPLGVKPGEKVWVTEGPLKADIATFFGYPCVGVPGTGTWRTILPCLKHWGTKKVVIAFDADRQRNQSVQREFLAFANELQNRGYEVMVATWDESDGNGIDDLLRNGCHPCVEPLDYTNPPFQITRTGLIRWQDERTSPAVTTPADLWKLLNTFDNAVQEDLFLTPTALVWLAIFRNAIDSRAALSEKAIATQTGLSERTVKRAVAELKQRGFIRVVRGNNLKKAPSEYCLPDTLPAAFSAA